MGSNVYSSYYTHEKGELYSFYYKFSFSPRVSKKLPFFNSNIWTNKGSFNGSQQLKAELLLVFSVTIYGSHHSIVSPGF